ncbi:NAD(P)-binding protein, partial [Atractiella rhizophila]
MITLAGSKIVIIGGTSGIGFAVAVSSIQSLASHVIVASSNPERVANAVTRGESAIKASDLTHEYKLEGKTLDISNLEQITKFFEEVGEIDHLIITARYRNIMPDMDTLKAGMDTRYWGPMHAAQIAKVKPLGSVTFTTSSVVY